LSKPSSVKYTYEDYLLFPDDGKRREIIDGDLYVSPSPNTKHQRASMNLSGLIHTFLKKNPMGEVFAAPFDVVFSDENIVQPDLLFISRERSDVLTEKHVRGAPDLVVEILSESTRRTDEKIKSKLFESRSVREYWIVDPELEMVKVYRPGDSGFTRVAELHADAADTLTTPLLPGLVLSIKEVFE